MSLPPDLAPGDPLAVDVFPGRVVTHVGIVSHVGPEGIHVISASARRRGVHEEPLHVFAQGGAPYRPSIAHRVPRAVALARARAALGRSYAVFTDNCEHLVYDCLGHRRRSPQLRAWLRGVATVAVGTVGVVASVVAARARRRA